MNRFLGDVVEHNLRIFGYPVVDGRLDGVDVFSSQQLEQAKVYAAGGGVSILCVEHEETSVLGETIEQHTDIGIQNRMVLADSEWTAPCKLATLHPYLSFTGNEDRQAIVQDAKGRDVWLWKPVGEGGILLLGTNLAGDVIQLRQGDPEKGKNPDTTIRWGIAGERPNYLYDDQRAGAQKYDRDADWWGMLLARTVAEFARKDLLPLLPNNAKGAVVITGDDDQAFLEKYEEQLAVLDGLPVTYFLHPLTKHSKETLQSMLGGARVDLGLHPDALDDPEDYDDTFASQARWFQDLTGKEARSVRNHGFLNRGYWGHLTAWLKAKIDIGSHVPGLDGDLIASSLIPARVHYDGALTSHWSIMMAIGDGVVFVHKMSPQECRECVLSLGTEIINSGLPGVMVLNLHPQNVTEAIGLHEAIHDLVKKGFVPWNMDECYKWFNARDKGAVASSPVYTPRKTKSVWSRWIQKVFPKNALKKA